MLMAVSHCYRQARRTAPLTRRASVPGDATSIRLDGQMLWKSAKSSLNAKVMRLLAVVIAILLAGNGLVFAFVIWPTFTDLENGAAQQNLQRVQEALSKERDDLARVAHDWSAWDPTYEYVVKPNEDYDRQSFTYD